MIRESPKHAYWPGSFYARLNEIQCIVGNDSVRGVRRERGKGEGGEEGGEVGDA